MPDSFLYLVFLLVHDRVNWIANYLDTVVVAPVVGTGMT